MSDDINFQARICPYCFDDHTSEFCKTSDVKEEVTSLREKLTRLEADLQTAVEALVSIQNANGSPFDEDFVTTEARAALEKIKRGEG